MSEPTVDRDDFETHDGAGKPTNLDSTIGPEAILEPSTKPGSLGRLAQFEVLEVLGNGGFGAVVKAFDEKLHRLVAIKLMSPFLAATAAPRKRFVREARTAATRM
jgi:serine/threonine protein kinase